MLILFVYVLWLKIHRILGIVGPMKNIMAHWKTTTGNSTRYQPGTWYHTYLVDLPNKKLCRASSFSTSQCVKMGTMFPFHFLHTHHSKGQVRARDWCHLVSGNLPGSTWYTWYQCCITHSITCPCTAKDDFCFFCFLFLFSCLLCLCWTHSFAPGCLIISLLHRFIVYCHLGVQHIYFLLFCSGGGCFFCTDFFFPSFGHQDQEASCCQHFGRSWETRRHGGDTERHGGTLGDSGRHWGTWEGIERHQKAWGIPRRHDYCTGKLLFLLFSFVSLLCMPSGTSLFLLQRVIFLFMYTGWLFLLLLSLDSGHDTG